MHQRVLKHLEEQDEEDLRHDKEQSSSWKYLGSFFHTSAKEIKEQKRARDYTRLQRVATRRLEENTLEEYKGKLQKQRNELQKVNDSIFQNVEKEDEIRLAEERAKARQREKARGARGAREAREAREA